ncbi:MAG: hypothetical protein IJ244_09020 [Bacteroidaceae bacterium]|nr:hypothetical protein [Bacteroidaceae bacterium]
MEKKHQDIPTGQKADGRKHTMPFGMLTVLMGIIVFLTCLYPLRALLNYYEELHLFRFSGAYLRDLAQSWSGLREIVVSFITQFFYNGLTGALTVALLFVALHWCLWLWLRQCGKSRVMLYAASFLPSLLLFVCGFLPRPLLTDPTFRELLTYHYLMRTHQWQPIVWKAVHSSPLSDYSLRVANFALAMQGKLPDDMFALHQTGPLGLLSDAGTGNHLPSAAMSDIFLQLGLVADAERMAFDALQFIPHGRRSGRLYRRLAEANLAGGDYRVAAKYLQCLSSSLFYGRWARRQLAHMGDETYFSSQYGHLRSLIPTDRNQLIPPDKGQWLADLYRLHPENRMALAYLWAYDLLSGRQSLVLQHTQQALQKGYQSTLPLPVQECIIGNWLLRGEGQGTPPIPASEELISHTAALLQSLGQAAASPQAAPTGSYWHYRMEKEMQKKP